MNHEHFLWVEKYRPSTIEECILPKRIKEQVAAQVESGQISHYLFSGTGGVGKTTLAKAIANEVGADLLYINCSNETGVDTIRNKIVGFASTVSMEDNLKIVLCDEADYMSQNAQAALRSIIESFSATTRFIFTCNFKNKIIEPLHSRCTTIDFKVTQEEKQDIMAQFLRRVVKILKAENIEYEPKAVVTFVQKYFPDFRKTLNELQNYSKGGAIDSGILVDENTTIEELVLHLKKKSFKEARAWMARNPDFDHQQLFSYFYEKAVDLFQPAYVPSLILSLAQYQHMSAMVVDQEINSMALLVEIMSEAVWK